jgi:hypothetical protein
MTAIRLRYPSGPGRGPGGGCGRPGGDSRRCPVLGCDCVISATRLMCRAHWYQVPKQARDRIWSAWRSGAGLFTPAYRQAVDEAIAAVSAAQCKPAVSDHRHPHASRYGALMSGERGRRPTGQEIKRQGPECGHRHLT